MLYLTVVPRDAGLAGAPSPGFPGPCRQMGNSCSCGWWLPEGRAGRWF